MKEGKDDKKLNENFLVKERFWSDDKACQMNGQIRFKLKDILIKK